MVRDWEKRLYDFTRPNNFNPFLMPKGRLRDDLIAAYYHLHGEEILSGLNLAGRSRVRAHCWELEPAEMRQKTQARMVVQWNSHLQRMRSGTTNLSNSSEPEHPCLAGPGFLGSAHMCTGQTCCPEAVGIYKLL